MLGQLFEPWAAHLITRAGLKPGCSVLDVASGLGPVARLAAEAAGPGGRVVASDISGAMLAVASARPHGSGWAAIEYLQCPASAIAAEDDSFDVVLCQHGLQFFPDRAAAAAEMQRSAKSEIRSRDVMGESSIWECARGANYFFSSMAWSSRTVAGAWPA